MNTLSIWGASADWQEAPLTFKHPQALPEAPRRVNGVQGSFPWPPEAHKTGAKDNFYA
jgi:hypothetical protein